jgi:hypothetical protein
MRWTSGCGVCCATVDEAFACGTTKTAAAHALRTGTSSTKRVRAAARNLTRAAAAGALRETIPTSPLKIPMGIGR